MTTSKPLVITMGEPSGIGPELILAAWANRDKLNLPLFAVTGDPDHLEHVGKDTGLEISLTTITEFPDDHLSSDALPVIPIPLNKPVEYGRPDKANASAVIASIESAVELVHSGSASGIVTAPIQKAVLADAGFAHPGHTEFLASLAAKWGKKYTNLRPVMMLAAGDFRVIPATIHIPLGEVSGRLTIDLLIETGMIVATSLKTRFGIPDPRLWFSGLNPHAGENGMLGNEDSEIIAPAVDILKERGVSAAGPFPADTMFHERARQQYDAAIAMYHDQALVPVKTVAFDTAVNITLGLPFVRTSPDHGTALDIAGTGKASPESMIAAIRMAHELSKARTS